MRVGGQNALCATGPSLILQQFRTARRLPIKGAAALGNYPQEDRLLLATFVLAQALVICSLPHTKQNRKCL
jgi:hypothetical protein